MRVLPWLSVAILGAFVAGACGSGDGETAGGGTGLAGNAGQANGGSAGAAGTSNGGSGGFLDASSSEVESISVDPPSATIQVVNGAVAATQFTARANLVGGGTQDVAASWSFDRLDLASITAGGGALTPRGNKGGAGTVTASVTTSDGTVLTATAQVTISLSLEANTAMLSPGDIAAFDTPDANPSGSFLYPYDQTVFARGLLPPELMWSGGNAGDQYKVNISSTYVTLTGYINADPPSSVAVPKDWWDQLAESSDGSPISVSVQRKEAGGAAHAAMTETWRIAPGSLRGTIYYWAVNLGQIVKLNPGADAPVPAFDPGAYDQLGSPAPIAGYGGESPPWDANSSGKRCVACHTVSRDGSRLAALFSACGTANGACARPWGVVDTASEQIQVLSTYNPAPAIFSALTPNGSHLVYDTVSFDMVLADAATGAPIPSELDSMSASVNMAHPQFSPDGNLLAYAANVQGGYPVEFSSSDLEILDAHVGSGNHFSNRRQIMAGNGQELAFPTFTPDSQWVLYQRGNYSRASFGAAAPFQTGSNDLFMVPVDGSATEIRLGKANGDGVLGAKDASRNYQPRVNPVSVGGYYWVVFVSPRDYGNKMASGSDSTNENRKQLWVAAIDTNPTPGTDPSHPAFRLPGQELGAINMDAYWALEPCKQQGNSCSEGYECCTGFCREQGDGSLACVPPPTNDCARIGETCATAADCCDTSAVCVGGLCSQAGPK
ncbi:MAG: hypothetical protein R3B07_35595 [Polyangiaceae bacterium]